jgi:type I restriction enzyme S subunit
VQTFLNVGAVFDSLKCADIPNFELTIPPISEQKRIAHILGTLDDKIELNRRMAATLEEMARAIFKSWFIDFDPVRAKSEVQPTGLPLEIEALFPDEFDAEGVPKGWGYDEVAAIGEIICGKTPSTANPKYYGDDLPFITIPDMHRQTFALCTSKSLSNDGANSQKNKTLQPGTVCVSCIATPGLVVIVDRPSQTNQQINSVVPKDMQESFFWFHSLAGLGDEIRAAGSGGSVLSNLSTGRFSALKVLFPPASLRRTFHARVKALMDRSRAAAQEIEVLSEIRDALLPKLISGQIEHL